MFDEVALLIHDLDMGMLPISVLAPYIPIAAHRKRDQCVPAQACLQALYTRRVEQDLGRHGQHVVLGQPLLAARTFSGAGCLMGCSWGHRLGLLRREQSTDRLWLQQRMQALSLPWPARS